MIALVPSLTAALLLGAPQIEWRAPGGFLVDGPYQAHLELTAPEGGATVVGWLLTPAAFSIDGKPLAPREDRGTLQLPPGAHLQVDVNLGPFIEADEDFELAFAKEYWEGEPLRVRALRSAPPGVAWMELPAENLAGYQVLLSTSRGQMLFELWPDVAPEHVRNYLELCATGFYDGTLFHRVGEGFMIQGGCPNTAGDDVPTWGRGDGPRRLALEPSDRPHVRGVLSMARENARDSASCQFFVVHAKRNAGLDGEYSAFGKLVTGFDTLDLIAAAEHGEAIDDWTWRPRHPQRVLQAHVVLTPEKR